jgi:dipeptidyl aminopeptidase/acylaminoacyl peptidase
MTVRAPFGSWRSEIRSADIAAGARRLSQPRIDAGYVYWLEGRPSEGGRQCVVRAPLADPSAGHEDVTPADANVRTRVHEYGGGDYRVHRGRIEFVRFDDQRIWSTGDGHAEPVSPPGPRYADLVGSPDDGLLVAVEERDMGGAEPENRLVCFRRDASRALDPQPIVLFEGSDFVSSPAFSADGRRLAFTCWRHPDMPWDSTELWEIDMGPSGPAGAPRRLAGGGGESIMQPAYTATGALTFVSDRSGWWNLHVLQDDAVHPLCPREAEFGGPQWVFGLSAYACIDDGTILCVRREGGRDVLGRLASGSGRLEDYDLPFTEISYVRAQGRSACFVAGSSTEAPGVYVLGLETGELQLARSGTSNALDPAWISAGEPVRFGSGDGREAYAYYYAPKNPDCEAPAGERPPLLVKSHGGPTAAAYSGLDARVQYWTSRGFAYLDVDYAGSTGYGRAYRRSLAGQWGVYDVEDCIAGARAMAELGRVDSQRQAISGGSAGGYTTLCALTFHDAFAAGASYYGIGDLEALARDTHKFEARYLDGLIGPYPARRDLYVARSPIHATERLSCPVIFFQGLEDQVVPPNQSEAMARALAERGIAHAYVTFEGEQHGFRKAANICTALDGEAWFYGRVFGFDVGDAPDGVSIVPGKGLFE